MTAFSIVAIIAMALVALWSVLNPLWQNLNAEMEADSSQQRMLAELEQQRNGLYNTIRELDLDFEADKISNEDYQRVRTDLMRQAAIVLKQIDRLSQNLDTQLDEEIDRLLTKSHSNGATAPHTKNTALLEAVRKEIKQAATNVPNNTCPQCATAINNDDVFCMNCGTPLGNTCSNCQAPFMSSDVFCRQCGARLAVEEAQ